TGDSQHARKWLERYRSGRGYREIGEDHGPPQLVPRVQVIRQAAVPVNQLRPRNAAGGDVDHDAAPDRPLLEVFPAETGIQAESVAGYPDTVAEVDVFHAGFGEAFVESAHFPEYTGANCAQTGPERTGFGIAQFVHARVRQVLVLRHEVALARVQVVRAENPRDV